MALIAEDFDSTSSMADVPATATFQPSQIAHFEVSLNVMFKTLSAVTHKFKGFTAHAREKDLLRQALPNNDRKRRFRIRLATY